MNLHNRHSQGANNAAYIVHACNAYPRLMAEREELIAALRATTEAHSADTVKAAIQHYGRNRGEVEKASKARSAARALLAKLWEGDK